MPTAASVTVDLAQVQGLVHHFYPLACSRYLLFRVESPAAGRAFMASVLPRVTFAADAPGVQCVNVGVTFEGLGALAVPAAVLAEFPEDFKEGPSATVMGDLAESAPQHWWAGRFATKDIHLIVQLSAANEASLEALTSEIRHHAATARVVELFPSSEQSTIDGRHLGDRRLHFGYRDGISQPDVAWSDAEPAAAKINFRHFVLGYSVPDISSSPKVVASRPASSAEATSMAVNGSYGILRWLHQDVAGFNRFLQSEGPRLFPNLPPADAEELLAAKLIGRWRDGTPLVLSEDRPQPELDSAVDFGYEKDPNGMRCPIAAHVRVVNPRDQKLSFAEFGFVPRVIRRGTPFGPPLTGTVDDGQLRGLVGLFLCSSISDQFYKLMSWMKRTDFSPSFTNPMGQDPLGDRHIAGASAKFEIPSSTGTQSVQLIQFTRTLGTAFVFLPGRSGLQRLSSAN